MNPLGTDHASIASWAIGVTLTRNARAAKVGQRPAKSGWGNRRSHMAARPLRSSNAVIIGSVPGIQGPPTGPWERLTQARFCQWRRAKGPFFVPSFAGSSLSLLSCSSLAERSSPSRVRSAAPNNDAPFTAPGRSELHLLIREKGSFCKAAGNPGARRPKWPLSFFTATDTRFWVSVR